MEQLETIRLRKKILRTVVPQVRVETNAEFNEVVSSFKCLVVVSLTTWALKTV